jgi:antibiotic biosynthesis monooxygenase (ABM) superfamily enzyme
MASGDPPDPARPVLRVRGPRASTVIVHRFPADHADAFLDWLHGITGAAGAFPGYQATEVYPPGGDHDDAWVVIIHFDDEATLGAWLGAPERAAWVARLPHAARDFRIRTMPGGFGSWVAGQAGDGADAARVPHWKSFLLVLLALYPTVMVLTLFVSPRTAGLGLPLAMLLGNVMSVAILEWGVMPLLNRLLGPWLAADGRDGRRVSIIGAALVVAAVLAMALGFRLAGA